MKFIYILTTLGLLTNAYTKEIQEVVQPGKSMLLGMGYDSEKESRRGECLKPKAIVKEGKNISNLDFSMRISQKELAKSLGMSAGARHRSGVTTVSGSARFLKNSKSSSFSITSTYTGDYQFKDKIFSAPELNELGIKLSENPERFKETCGDYYTRSQSFGAKIFFSIRVDFKTAESKKEFEAKFSLSSPMTDVVANLKKSKNSFSKDTKVTVQALQIGGDVSKLSSIFVKEGGNSEGSYAFVKCSFGDLVKCEDVLQNAMEYATNTNTGFPSQITNETNAALLSAVYADYRTAGIYIEMTPQMNDQIEIARNRISNQFEKAFDQYQTVFNYINNGVMRLSALQKQKFTKMEQALYTSLDELASLSTKCFDSPLRCPKHALKAVPANNELITEYKDDEFIIHPETLAQYCDIALTPFANRSYTEFIKQLINTAYYENPDFFIGDSSDQSLDSIDFCGRIEDYMGNNSEINLSHELVSEVLKEEILPFPLQEDESFLIEDITPIQSLNHLTKVDLSGHEISNITALKELVKLKWLNLSQNYIMDIKDLEKLKRLQYLGLSDNEIDDLSILRNHRRINRLDITNNLYEVQCPFTETRICLDVDYRTNNSLSFIDRYSNPRRWLSQSTKLNNGDILITGGRFDLESKKAEIYSSAHDQFITLRSTLNQPRYEHQMTVLDDGNVLITGGQGSKFGAELFLKDENRFEVLEKMKSPHIAHQAIKLLDGKILITGGRKGTHDTYSGLDTSPFAQLYDPNTRTFQRISSMKVPRIGHTMTLLKNGNVIIIGGHDYHSSKNSIEIYNHKTESFKKLNFRLRIGRSYHAAHLINDNEIAVLGGLYEKGNATDHIEIIDLKRNKSRLLKEKLKEKRAFQSSKMLSNGSILLIGGASRNQRLASIHEEFDHAIKSMEIFDPFIELSVKVSRELIYDRVQANAQILDDNRVLIFGGRGDRSSKTASLFEYTF